MRDPAGGPGFTPASLLTALTEMQLPPTVQGVLAARIDRLPLEEKALLQTLAVIGKEFALSLLTRVVEQPEDEVQRLLAHLRAAEFIYEQPTFPEPEYTFKHALTQEVAYNALPLERRRRLHERTGQAIEALFPSRLEDYYGALAHHYSHSGNARKAVEYLQRAGQQAVQRSAYAEAISHVTMALELLETLPDTVERAQRELVLQITLGQAMGPRRGWGHREREGHMLGRGSYASRWGRPRSSLRRWLDSMNFMYSKGSTKRRRSWQSRSSAWPSASVPQRSL